MQIQQNTLELTICQLEARRQEIADSSQDLSSENRTRTAGRRSARGRCGSCRPKRRSLKR
ncbi:MAG: hypothetical protein ACLT76_00400 [Clostridium fessum]